MFTFFKGTTTITGARADAAELEADEQSKQIIFKYFAAFTNHISKTNNIQANKAQDLDFVMAIPNLMEYSNDYSKMSQMLL